MEEEKGEVSQKMNQLALQEGAKYLIKKSHFSLTSKLNLRRFS